jgi:arylsulfatase A-like enzyme
VEFIEEHDQAAEPLFLYFALNTPHVPWVAPEGFAGKSPVGPYGDMILLADHAVGRVVEALRRKRMLDDTLLIFTSDNGSPRHALGEHACVGPWRGRKNTIWEGGHRVPFVARWPGRVPAGAESDQLLCLVDMVASFAGLLGEELPAGAAPDSFDLSPAWGDAAVRCERPGLVNDTTRGDMSLRQGDWKLVELSAQTEPEGRREMLFHLADDPAEERDLSEAEPARFERMRALLNRLRGETSRAVFAR